MPDALTAAQEWRRFALLPLAAGLGYATSVIHIYGMGVYIEPITREFGWSRTQVAAGMTIATVIQAFASIPVGIAVDRFGPRVLALVGALLTAAAFANLSRASGGVTDWYLSWIIMALANLPVQATVWTNAVATRFSTSRGLALAVTLCGASVALALFPWLGAKLIESHGWRQAMRLEALIWIAIAWPVIFLFFRSARDAAPKKGESVVRLEPLSGVSIREGLTSPVYLRLLIAALLFTFTMIGLNVHFPLILKVQGFSPLEAAGVASLIGLSSIFGRLGTGLMLDRFRGSIVGAIAFALPALACALLLLGNGGGLRASAAAVLLGLSLGAEIDVLVFLTTVYFGLRHFGVLYGGLLAALSIGTAFGPLAAATVFDKWQGYDPFLWTTIALMVLSSAALASLPRPKGPTLHAH